MVGRSKNNSRTKLLETTTELLRQQGYNGTGLNQIIKVSGAPKGSLYHYFPGGKEQLAAEAINLANANVLERLELAFEENRTTAEALTLILDVTVMELEESSFSCGCPIATVALEVSATSDKVQEACHRAFKGSLEFFEGRLRADGLSEERAKDVANLLFAAYEGALLLSRGQRDTTPLRRLKNMIPSLLSS